MQPDLLVFGGDLISGPMPLETLDLIYDLKSKYRTASVLGNNDQDIIDSYENKKLSLSNKAQEQIKWVTRLLNEKQILDLKDMPININVGKYFFCHAIADDNRTIFTQKTRISNIKQLFLEVISPFIICGHTHLQFKLKIGSQQIINAGSVGMPFSDKKGAQWLWIENNNFQFRRTLFDEDIAIKNMKNSDFPFVNQFIEEYVKNTVKVRTGYKILRRLEENNRLRK
ncbi:metallophosphoesterase family protein [Oenococcus oeni]|uniref:Phosphoesterase n=3 Tax=Oenococcus oeni TaxID=1247 RepID=A0A483BD88_OENOE|nr:metallophosphoesterase family protein [Oenococcus oeni]EAV39121.1 hypothetical protein OENOO_62072 [Oenococcus oeni ATCC BAA-1163]EJN99010.1 calcineurin-like phosphoesterase [Oenococcus oeni AWRIB418]KDE87815.1 phosphoesterase [Oenococcus oeni]KEP87108.1 phosphoesterase [Oenococcus oeni IOEB_0501]KGH57376.1 phosphoesterase [Oenococcus oeni IOEB_9805]